MARIAFLGLRPGSLRMEFFDVALVPSCHDAHGCEQTRRHPPAQHNLVVPHPHILTWHLQASQPWLRAPPCRRWHSLRAPPSPSPASFPWQLRALRRLRAEAQAAAACCQLGHSPQLPPLWNQRAGPTSMPLSLGYTNMSRPRPGLSQSASLKLLSCEGLLHIVCCCMQRTAAGRAAAGAPRAPRSPETPTTNVSDDAASSPGGRRVAGRGALQPNHNHYVATVAHLDCECRQRDKQGAGAHVSSCHCGRH